MKPGEVLEGKYKILERLGQGGMSNVYLAINEKANKTWAIKELRKDADLPEGWISERLLSETELLKRLRHPYLPGIADVIERAGEILIVMDYMEGNSLERLLEEEGAQSQEQVVRWGIQLCEVLRYLHRQNPPIVYRDMKPSNVILRPDGRVALIDFGTAREVKERTGQEDTVCLGTPGYASPEQWAGCGQTDARSDIYCLGMTLYHLASGHSPAETGSEMRPLRSWNAQLSSGLEAILLKCVRRDPKDRYQNCEELQYALEHYREQDEVCLRLQKRKLRIFLGIFALSLVLTAVAAGTARRGRRLRTDTYEAWLEQALSERETEAKLQAYQRAVRLEPQRPEAYLEILQTVFLQVDEDGVIRFTKEEELWMRKLFLLEKEEGKSCEWFLRQTEAAYAQVAYELGLAYYYDYEGTGNKAYAVKWLQTAAHSETLQARLRERAKRLAVIAEYYGQIGRVSKAGDLWVSGRTYWNELVDLTKGNLAELDNATTALRMYQECIAQMHTRTQEFVRAGVTQAEMEQQLEQIRRHLETDFRQSDLEYAGLQEMWQVLKEQLPETEKQVRAAYAYRKLEEQEGDFYGTGRTND